VTLSASRASRIGRIRLAGTDGARASRHHAAATRRPRGPYVATRLADGSTVIRLAPRRSFGVRWRTCRASRPRHAVVASAADLPRLATRAAVAIDTGTLNASSAQPAIGRWANVIGAARKAVRPAIETLHRPWCECVAKADAADVADATGNTPPAVSASGNTEATVKSHRGCHVDWHCSVVRQVGDRLALLQWRLTTGRDDESNSKLAHARLPSLNRLTDGRVVPCGALSHLVN
jgi:hypothetical protein